SLRAWLDPQELAARNMTAVDVADAVRTQNIEAALGQIGQAPMSRAQAFQVPIDTLGRLSDPNRFGDIIVKAPATRPAAATGGTPPPGRTGMPSSGITNPLLAALVTPATASGSSNSGTVANQLTASDASSIGTTTMSPTSRPTSNSAQTGAGTGSTTGG